MALVSQATSPATAARGCWDLATLCQLHPCQLSAPQDKLSAAIKVFSTQLIFSEWKNISVSFKAQTCYPCRRVDAKASLWGESYDAVQLAQQEEVLLQKLCYVWKMSLLVQCMQRTVGFVDTAYAGYPYSIVALVDEAW